MFKTTALIALSFVLMLVTKSSAEDSKPPALDHDMQTLSGDDVNLADEYNGDVVLLVNVASECGLTPQYEALQALHSKYADQGLSVVGVPCNQFGGQEPGDHSEIANFCQKNYGVEFDLLSKVDVNGANACALYKYLTSKETNPDYAGKINWNFEKFLLNRQGDVVARFSPRVEPDSPEVVQAIERALVVEPQSAE